MKKKRLAKNYKNYLQEILNLKKKLLKQDLLNAYIAIKLLLKENLLTLMLKEDMNNYYQR